MPAHDSCRMLHATSMPHVACRMSHGRMTYVAIACCMPNVAGRMLQSAYCMLHVACRMSHVACRMSTCHSLHVACCMSHVACCMSHVACRIFFWLSFRGSYLAFTRTYSPTPVKLRSRRRPDIAGWLGATGLSRVGVVRQHSPPAWRALR